MTRKFIVDILKNFISLIIDIFFTISPCFDNILVFIVVQNS